MPSIGQVYRVDFAVDVIDRESINERGITMMTRKHFRALANELANSKPETFEALVGWKCAVQAVMRACRADNPGFNESRFLRACNYDDVAAPAKPVRLF